jgi:hypothetical protein
VTATVSSLEPKLRVGLRRRVGRERLMKDGDQRYRSGPGAGAMRCAFGHLQHARGGAGVSLVTMSGDKLRARLRHQTTEDAAMKVKPECYPVMLDLSTRLAPVVPDGRAARERRRIESGVRASFALRPGEAITHASSDALIARSTRLN